MNFLPLLKAARAVGPLARLGSTQLRQAFVLAARTVGQVVQEELPAMGPAVQGLLTGPLREVITRKATGRVAAVLLARLGLRGALASTVAGLLVPIVLEIVVRRALKTDAWARLLAHENVVRLRETVERPFRSTSKDAASPDGPANASASAPAGTSPSAPPPAAA